MSSGHRMFCLEQGIAGEDTYSIHCTIILANSIFCIDPPSVYQNFIGGLPRMALTCGEAGCTWMK
jgi:hypothetical protein